ncbi:methylase [Actinomadura cremea]|nr:methylase [Actinomadura cremea]
MLLSTARTPAELDAMVERRAAGLPLEHVVGWAEFCGLRVGVAPGVFVPRRRTEYLVRRAAALAPPRPVVVDLCCGSGALGAALVAGLDEYELHAADIEPESVRCARRNVEPAGGRVYEGDLFEALPASLRGRVDVLLCNVPYVPSEEVALLPSEARDHEPRVALDGGGDGLAVLRRVTADAAGWLAPGGRLLSETSERQVADALDAVARGGLAAEVAHSEEFHATVVIGTKTLPPNRCTSP